MIPSNEGRSFDLRGGNERIAERRARGNAVNEGESARGKGGDGCSLNYGRHVMLAYKFRNRTFEKWITPRCTKETPCVLRVNKKRVQTGPLIC